MQRIDHTPDHGASFLSSSSHRFIPSETFAWTPLVADWDDVDVEATTEPLVHADADLEFGAVALAVPLLVYVIERVIIAGVSSAYMGSSLVHYIPELRWQLWA